MAGWLWLPGGLTLLVVDVGQVAALQELAAAVQKRLNCRVWSRGLLLEITERLQDSTAMVENCMQLGASSCVQLCGG